MSKQYRRLRSFWWGLLAGFVACWAVVFGVDLDTTLWAYKLGNALDHVLWLLGVPDRLSDHSGVGRSQIVYDVTGSLLCIPAIVVAVAVSLLSTQWRAWDGYTRCGQCNHILRGISEPRCPECGAPI